MDEMGEAADVRTDDGQAGGDGFDEHIACAFFTRGMEHDVCRLQQIGHVVSRSQKCEVLINTVFRDELLNVFRFVSANENEADIAFLVQKSVHRFADTVHAFPPKICADLDDDGFIVLKAEFAAHAGANFSGV